jgi:hypothetical protein
MNQANAGDSSMFADLLDTPLEEIAGLASYEIPPDGAYKLLVEKVEFKKDVQVKDRLADIISFNYKVMDAIELTDEMKRIDIQDTNGNLKDLRFNESFFFFKGDTESIKKTKDAMKTNWEEVAIGLKCSNLMEMVQKVEGMEVVCVLKRRVDANDSEKAYAQTRKVHLS